MPGGRERRGRPDAKRVRTGATRLTPAASLAAFAKAPHGRYLCGPSYLYCWPTADLCASVLFGEPTSDDLEALSRLFALELASPAEPHASLIDLRRVTRVDPTAFSVLTHYVEEHRELMATYVTRLSLVRPEGFIGALAAGFYETVTPPYPVESFSDGDAALAWVGGPPDLEGALAEIVAGQSGVSEMVRSVRGVIAARIPDATLASAAGDLGITVRTLQRRLSAEGTTFRTELASVQVAQAKHWLSETDVPITRIAFEVGVGTPQHLSALFKKATGQTPSEYRTSSS